VSAWLKLFLFSFKEDEISPGEYLEDTEEAAKYDYEILSRSLVPTK
jgi:hypothetical protein